jgi:hypothetical protein
MVRDAARLRSVMGRGERESEDPTAFGEDRDRLIPEPSGMAARGEADVDRDIIMPSLGEEARATASRRSTSEAPSRHEAIEAPHATPTTLRAPAAQPRRSAPIASAEETGAATTLRPVDALRELEERARIAAAARKMGPRETPTQAQGTARERAAAPGGAYEQEASGRRAVRTVEPEEIYREPRRQRRPRGRSLVGAITVFAGTAIGIGLYAGGGDILSRFFSNKNEGVTMENPAAVTERPQTIVPPPPASEMPSAGSAGSTESASAIAADPALSGPSTASTAAEVAVDKPVAEKPVNDKPVAENPAIAKPKSAAPSAPAEKQSTMVNNLGTTSPAKAAAKPATKPVAATTAKPAKPATDPAKSKPATAAKPTTPATYVVQVRATPDEAEANRIARKLRAKGVKDVKVDLMQKNGTAVYRVRYGTFASTAEAKSSAGSSGVGDAWVVKK